LLAAGSSISPIQETIFTTKGGLLNHLSSSAHRDNPRLHDAIAKVTAGGANVKVEFLEKIVEKSVPLQFSDKSSARANENSSLNKQEWWCELCYGFMDSNDFPDKAIVSLFKNKNSLLSHLNSIGKKYFTQISYLNYLNIFKQMLSSQKRPSTSRNLIKDCTSFK